eukprot:5396155-Prymnesium_polylepis.1
MDARPGSCGHAHCCRGRLIGARAPCWAASCSTRRAPPLARRRAATAAAPRARRASGPKTRAGHWAGRGRSSSAAAASACAVVARRPAVGSARPLPPPPRLGQGRRPRQAPPSRIAGAPSAATLPLERCLASSVALTPSASAALGAPAAAAAAALAAAAAAAEGALAAALGESASSSEVRFHDDRSESSDARIASSECALVSMSRCERREVRPKCSRPCDGTCKHGGAHGARDGPWRGGRGGCCGCCARCAVRVWPNMFWRARGRVTVLGSGGRCASALR